MFTVAVGLIIAALAICAIIHPWIGILGWTWVSIMNPHVLTWRLANMPVAATIAVAVLIGLITTKDKRIFVPTAESGVLLIFMLWMCITLPFSMDLGESYPLWKRVMKIDLMILIALVLLYSKRHIMALTWVLVGSLAFYGVKGGIFTLATGGNHRVWGPDGTYIGGNNEIALALILVIPLMRFLQLTTDKFWVRHMLTVTMLLSAVAAVGSYSRGAFLAIAAMAAVMWWRGANRLAVGLILVVSGAALLAFMPEGWEWRMSTIRNYGEDDSAMQRLNAWEMAWNIAKDRIFGAGFMVSTPAICSVYSPVPTDCRAAHSIYFMVLGEHGFIGLFLFITLWILVWRSAGRLRVEAARVPQARWLAALGTMAQVSLGGYAVGGAFLSLSYFDLPYNILVLVVVGRKWLERRAWVEEDQLKSETRSERLPVNSDNRGVVRS